MSKTYGSSPLLGQASSGWTESSSALRILNVGVRNSLGVAVDDAFTQTNPPSVAGVSKGAGAKDTEKLSVSAPRGALSGSVAFVRGNGRVGGPGKSEVSWTTGSGNNTSTSYASVVPVGVFINSAAGSNPYENIPAAASGRLPYVCGFGTYGVSLYETHEQMASATKAVVYHPGDYLFGSVNGYLTSVAADSYEKVAGATDPVVIGVVLVASDAGNSELVYDQRI